MTSSKNNAKITLMLFLGKLLPEFPEPLFPLGTIYTIGDSWYVYTGQSHWHKMV